MKEKLNIAVFLAALALLFVLVVVLPPDDGASDFENRSMAARPGLSVSSFLDGSFFQDIEEYFSDAAAYRTSLLQFAADVEHSYGIRFSGGAIMVDFSVEDLGFGLIPDVDEEDLALPLPDDTVEPPPSDAEEPPPSGTPPSFPPAPAASTGAPDMAQPATPEAQPDGGDTPPGATPHEAAPHEPPDPGEALAPPPPPPPPRRVDPSRPFSVDVHFNEGAILYERYRENAEAARRYAEILNSYMDYIPENVRVFSMLAPIRVEFMGARYAAANDSQRGTIDLINGLLDERIIRTAAYERLHAHSGEYIYFRTDHHWTALGAYYAYLSFTQAAGFAPIDISNYLEHSIPDFLGSYGRGTTNRTVRDHPDTLYYYVLDTGTTFSRRLFVIPEDLSRLSYRVFMGGDFPILNFTSSNRNGNTLVVVKDSFANALIPWLAPHYGRIIVIDPRQFDGSVTELLGEYARVDLLFMNYVAATAMTDFIETIYNVR